MSGFQISWTIEGEKQLSRTLQGLSTSVKDFRKPLTQSANRLISVFSRDVFDSEGGAIAEKWARLSPHTVAQKARLGYGSKGILERTGKMRRSFDSVVESTQAVIGNTAEYFKYHQSNQARSGRLPRRVMMKLAENQKQMVVKFFQDYIRNL